MAKNPNALADARGRMLRNLEARMEKAVGHRGDLFIADFRRVDEDAGHLLLGYEKTIGPVGSTDVTSFVSRQFQGLVRPIMETAKQHRAEGAVSLLIHRSVPTRKIEDRRSMLAVSNTHFLDQQLGDTWEVRSQADGTKYLARLSTDDITNIVAERRRRMTIRASTVTFANTLSAGVPNISLGDQVRFYDGGQLLDGKVTGVGTDVRITAAAGNYTVAPEAVVEILQASPETRDSIKGYLNEYFADAYGFENYAGELTDRLA